MSTEGAQAAEQNGSAERRSQSRYGRELWARYRIEGAGSPVWLESKVLNLSHAGLCLAIVDDRKTVQPLVDVDGERPKLQLEVPLDSENNELATGMFRCMAGIRWVRKPGLLSRTLMVGLEFESHSEEMQRLLREYIKAQFMATYQDYREGDGAGA